jgi:hypothetical protein
MKKKRFLSLKKQRSCRQGCLRSQPRINRSAVGFFTSAETVCAFKILPKQRNQRYDDGVEVNKLGFQYRSKIMNKLLMLFLLLLAQAFIPVYIYAQEKESVFEIPLKYISFMLLNDPKCPIQLSKPRAIADKDGDLHYYLTMTNNSPQILKSFEIKEFDAFVNPSYEYTPNASANGGFSLLPDESFAFTFDNTRFDITDLDEKRAAEIGLSERNKKIWIALVTKVESYDGTTYDATSKYSRIKKFIDQIQNEAYEAEDDDEAPKLTYEEKETKLRNFITETMQNDK